MTEEGQPAGELVHGTDTCPADVSTPVTVIENVTDLLGLVTGRSEQGVRWYRGQRDADWTLRPGISRNANHLRHEMLLLKDFKRDAVHRIAVQPSSDWGWLALAQHYGLPTRMLDWSEHPLVGLYFAVEDNEADGRLYELDPESLNAKSYPDAPRVLLLDHDSELDTYLPGSSGAPSDPLAVTAMKTFERINVQVGTFTICQRGEDLQSSDLISSWVIPASRKPHIRGELADLNITASTVYPDLTHLAAHLKDRYA